MADWKSALELDGRRSVVAGSSEALRSAIRRGADLRIYTEFLHNEHIDTTSDSPELVREVAEFRVTYLVDDQWAAGIMTLRQPVDLPAGFGPRPSMSFFMYNEDGRQAIARPHLDGYAAGGDKGPAPRDDHAGMPRYHRYDAWDAATNAPSENFVYDFDLFRYWVRDDWVEVLSHGPEGEVRWGSVEALAEAFAGGAEVKVAVRDLCGDLSDDPPGAPDHEVFVQTNSCYYYTDQKLFIAATHPLVRVRPAIPMEYTTDGWDFGWAMLRTDGFAALRLADPYSLGFRDSESRYALRWFVR